MVGVRSILCDPREKFKLDSRLQELSDLVHYNSSITFILLKIFSERKVTCQGIGYLIFYGVMPIANFYLTHPFLDLVSGRS